MKTIDIFICGLDYGQDVYPLVKAFLPDAAVTVTNTSEQAVQSEQKDDCIVFCLKEDRFSASLKLFGKELFVEDDFSETPDMCYRNSGLPDRRMYRNHLHRALYNILKEATGKTLPWGTLTGVRPTKQVFEMQRQSYSDDSIISYFENEYCCSKKKADLAIRVSKKERELLSKLSFDDTYSLYIGIPFCPSICLYCSFSSYPLKQYAKMTEPYVDALLKEIEAVAPIFRNKKLVTVYFGGGTPTSISAEQLRRIIRKVKECFDLKNLHEWTIEAGRPDSITEEKLLAMREEGIDRISVNPQTMQDRTLELIGRRHTVSDVKNAFHLARKTGFKNINMDLIAGLNGENFEDFKNTLDEVVLLDPDSVTVHTLAIKRAARLNAEMDVYHDSLSDDTKKMVDYAQSFLTDRGIEPYYLYRQKNMSDNLENVGYAKPGSEGLYNVLIMEECHTILACGAGASSKLVRADEKYGSGFINELNDEEYFVRKIERAENVKSVKDYIERTDEMIERKRKLFCNPE